MLTREQFLKKLGKNITNLRKQQNLSIKELSAKSNISAKYLLKIENGEAIKVSSKHIFYLKLALDVSFKDIFKNL